MSAMRAITILGPTATGKSEVAIELALISNGEVVSADSMQVYRFMDIGTAKPDEARMRGVRHHMIGVCDPDEPMSVAKYCELAKRACWGIMERGKLPIIVGGTGLYIDALTRGFLFPDSEADHALREKLYDKAESEGSAALHCELAAKDPEAASKIHHNDIRRIVRALEVFHKSGRPMSELQKKAGADETSVQSLFYGLKAERSFLINRIEQRVEKMMRDGLLDEVKQLVEMGFAESRVPMQAIGYKELVSYLKGQTNLMDAVATIKAETRKYSKRQMTWFRRNKDITWFDAELSDPKEIAETILDDFVARGAKV